MTILPDDCRAARRALLAREDGALPAAEHEALERHLAVCVSCRNRGKELDQALGALRSLPPTLPFPDEALESVWDRTIRAERNIAAPGAIRAMRPSRAAGWRLALAAAVLLVAVLGPYIALRARESVAPEAQSTAFVPLGPEELRAAAELRLVLQLTDRALQRSQRAAVDGVLRRGIDPALRRVPVLREIVPDRPPRRERSLEAVR